MRSVRWFVIAAVVGPVLAIPAGAGANGGAYIEFNRTHYLPGDTVVGEAYVFVPLGKQHLFDRGPFHAYVWTDQVRESRAIPDGALRVGTFSVEQLMPRQFELTVRFRMPDLAGRRYVVSLCNDPCTVSGFRESLVGEVSVVQTVREGTLLTKQSRLESRVYGLARDARRAERKVEILEPALTVSEEARTGLATEVTRLKAEIRRLEARLSPGAPPEPASQPASSSEDQAAARPLIDPWAAATVAAALVVLAAALTLRHRASPRSRSANLSSTFQSTERRAAVPRNRPTSATSSASASRTAGETLPNGLTVSTAGSRRLARSHVPTARPSTSAVGRRRPPPG